MLPPTSQSPGNDRRDVSKREAESWTQGTTTNTCWVPPCSSGRWPRQTPQQGLHDYPLSPQPLLPHHAPVAWTFFQGLKLPSSLPQGLYPGCSSWLKCALPHSNPHTLWAHMLERGWHKKILLHLVTLDEVIKLHFQTKSRRRISKYNWRSQESIPTFLLEWRSTPNCEEVVRHSWKQILPSKKIHLDSYLWIYLYYVLIN